MDDYKRKRLIIKGYRDIAVFGFVVMMTHTVLLLCGLHYDFAKYTFLLPIPAGISAIALSSLLHYCTTHRLCLGYVTLVSVCMTNQEEWFGFGTVLFEARLIVALLGVFILYKVIKAYQCNLWMKNAQND